MLGHGLQRVRVLDVLMVVRMVVGVLMVSVGVGVDVGRRGAVEDGDLERLVPKLAVMSQPLILPSLPPEQRPAGRGHY